MDDLIRSSQITGLILAGGRGSRMGGVDKGLQLLHGRPLIAHVLTRLQPQVGAVLINANRHLADYAVLGCPVIPDDDDQFKGPLAGLLAGLQATNTDWLLAVPCDAPRLPLDLAARLTAVCSDDVDVVFPVSTGQAQPTFCLLRSGLRADLAACLAGGGRKLESWLRAHKHIALPFDRAGDADAFFNANSRDDLQGLELSDAHAC